MKVYQTICLISLCDVNKDVNFNKACNFFKNFKGKLISKNKENPNPNLIFYSEINEELKNNCGAIWEL